MVEYDEDGHSGDTRLARNEAFFREVNERIDDVAASLGDDDHRYEYVCECSEPSCTDRIELTRDEYEHVREDEARFVLAPGHVTSQIESVVERDDDHVLIEKVGAAANVAFRLDPRAA